MDLSEWMGIYREILRDMGYSEERDGQSARHLAERLGGRHLVDIRDIRFALAGRVVVVTGGAVPSDDPGTVVEGHEPILACGRSIRICLDAGKVPAMVFTDLDGDMEAQMEASRRGSITVVHAHGDNMGAHHLLDGFTGPLVGTCQCEPVPPLHNFGGFTDGDRAVAFAIEMGVARVKLIGFRFDDAPTPTKARKLAWAERIVRTLDREAGGIVEMNG